MPRCLRLFVLVSFLFLFHAIRSQDVIYLNNGTKFEATVKEISATEIKYKNFTNPDGPTYVITKGDVLFIEYKNGVIDIINTNPLSFFPVKTETVSAKKEVQKNAPYELYYLNKNCLYFNGLALVNSDLAFIYEREFAKSRLSVTLLGAYNFNVHSNYTNRYIQALDNSRKNYDIGLGINYFTQTRKKSQYFIGLLFKYMNYQYVREVRTEDSTNGISFISVRTENVNNYQFASMLVNGVQVRVTPFFTYRLFIGLGFTNKDNDISKAVAEDLYQRPRSFPKAYLGMCVGYRFY